MKGWWGNFIETPHLGDYLSLIGLALTVVGFTATVIGTFRAKRSADSARDAAQAAAHEVRKVDLVAEFATVLQLIEELKRLQRSKAKDVLPERYSGLRAKIVAIRVSEFLAEEEDQALLQDVVARLSALEKSLDRNVDCLESPKQLARSNESLSICTDALLVVNERIKKR